MVAGVYMRNEHKNRTTGNIISYYNPQYTSKKTQSTFVVYNNRYYTQEYNISYT